MKNPLRTRPNLAILLVAALSVALSAQGTPVGFEETYALAADRGKVVETLIPGTEDWYWYRCRERLDARDFASVRTLLPAWIQRHGRTARVLEIENREALLGFSDAAERTFAFLRERLGLRFDHQRVVPGAPSDLPTRLDAELLSDTVLTQRALQRHPGTADGFRTRALAGLAGASLDADQMHSLLARLELPDVDNLPALIVRDLDHPQSGGFGSLKIHGGLRRMQLDECARLRPALLQSPEFVNAYLARLLPADSEWQYDAEARARQLARLSELAQRLSPAFNSLKAHVLFHWLRHELSQGAPDKEHFLAYIRLPRRTGHPAEKHLRQHRNGNELVDGNSTFATGLPAIGDDEPTVRACLEHFFVREDGYETYAEFLDADWLKAVLAETKILLGQGDMEKWYSLLDDPGRLAQIEKRVEIRFPPTSRTLYAAGDPVQLQVDTKNVPVLLVKVFAIDSYRYHQEKQRAVDASIDLDGIVATFEQTHTYTEPPLRRVRRTFDLPMLKEPGTWVVELVGNGISSRAVIHKGWLRHVERTAAAGQVFRVYDEAGVHQKDASAWFGGREYAADANGEILLPFSTAEGEKHIVLQKGNRSTLASFRHRVEKYELGAFVHVEREALIAGRRARIALRPQLRLDGHDVSLKLLTAPVLTLLATDIDGIATTQDVRDPALIDERELVHEIDVPERLVSLQVSLRGKVRDLAGKDVDLQAEPTRFTLNGQDLTAETGSVMLVRTSSGYALDLRGKNGEPRTGRTCQLQLAHRDYTDPVEVTLQSDENGRIDLGALPRIDSVTVQHPGGSPSSFRLDRPAFMPPRVGAGPAWGLNGRVGETLRLPYQGTSTSVSRAEFSLLGRERDEFGHLALADGFLELRDLPSGDYDLHLHETGWRLTVRVTRSERDGDWLVGRERILEATPTGPLHLRTIELTDAELVVRLANASPSTRVHVAATRFTPASSLFGQLRSLPPAQISASKRPAESSYHDGRILGDEHRYVLERRFATKFAGNMLRRPSLLLNPWSIDDHSRSVAQRPGMGGPGHLPSGETTGGSAIGTEGGAASHAVSTHANLDFLPQASATLANLTPDADGIVRVKLADLGEGQIVQVLALDGNQAVYDKLVRDEQALRPRARHLGTALDGSQHFTEQKRLEFVAAGGEASLGDPRSTQVEKFDSLASVHALLSTIRPDAGLAEFAFLMQWPQLTQPQKRELYGKHACHELHFFLSRKDPEFFAAVVKPSLANKLDKTFLDHFLLGDDLRRFLEPWAFAQLNLIEKVLLAQRLDGAGRDGIVRCLREALELRPVTAQVLEDLLEQTLAARRLAGTDDDLHKRAETQNAAKEYRGAKDEVPPPPKAAERAEAEDLERNLEARDDRGVEKNPPQAGGGAGDESRKRIDELRRRGDAGQLFRAVDATKLLVEHNWWHRRLEQCTPDVVAPNHFWIDYATAPAGQPFVSSAIVEAGG
ncbi:MAG TPA: hypothetical protein VF384_02885, partial [Planctomycetota bacterium]